MYFEHSASVHGVEKKILSLPERLLGDLGQGTGTQGALSVVGQSEVPWKCSRDGGGLWGRGAEAALVPHAELKLVQVQCTHTHTHTHIHTHTCYLGVDFSISSTSV